MASEQDDFWVYMMTATGSICLVNSDGDHADELWFARRQDAFDYADSLLDDCEPNEGVTIKTVQRSRMELEDVGLTPAEFEIVKV